MPKEITIAVIGLGLIGGSILRSLRPNKLRLVGVSRNEETIKKAISLNLLDKGSTDINIIKNADIVFICTPINKVLSTIDEVIKIVSKNCIITDVASLKEFIIDHINNYDFPVNFIGGHPMAGTEHQGIDYALDNLFEGAKWALTPSKWAGISELEKLKEIISYTGANIIICDAQEHDKSVAQISHVPLLLGQALFDFVNSYPEINIRELSLKLAASGFRDTTRLAGTNPELAKDMLIKNKANVKKTVKELKLFLDSLCLELDSNEEEFISHIEKISSQRKLMYSKDGKNIFNS
jgi:arogenate dehydrogenase (NADP+)